MVAMGRGSWKFGFCFVVYVRGTMWPTRGWERVNFVYFALFAISTKFCSTRKRFTCTSVLDTTLTVRKVIADESLPTLAYGKVRTFYAFGDFSDCAQLCVSVTLRVNGLVLLCHSLYFRLFPCISLTFHLSVQYEGYFDQGYSRTNLVLIQQGQIRIRLSARGTQVVEGRPTADIQDGRFPGAYRGKQAVNKLPTQY